MKGPESATIRAHPGQVREYNSTNKNYLSRFLEIVAYCYWVEAQRERLLGIFLESNARPWLTPLGGLSDRLANATMLLEESLTCEHPDYNQGDLYFRGHVRGNSHQDAKATPATLEEDDKGVEEKE